MSDLTDDLSPGGHPLVEITNLRDDQYFESCIWVDLFTEWSGSDVNIVRGRGYGFVTIADTTWNPTEYSNEAKAGVVRHLTDAHDIEIKVGSSSEQTRKPAWQMANGRWHIADGTWHMANGKHAEIRREGIEQRVGSQSLKSKAQCPARFRMLCLVILK